ncbi:MAG: DUF1858 domain-containing protein [Bacteroidia bacterium]|nr:DUF1858 domain-containing protein [Bacteroidia bacterium]
MSLEITHDTIIEDLVSAYPKSVVYLMDHGIRCLRCGEPIWGTLASAMEEKNIPVERQHELVQGLRDYLLQASSQDTGKDA